MAQVKASGHPRHGQPIWGILCRKRTGVSVRGVSMRQLWLSVAAAVGLSACDVNTTVPPNSMLGCSSDRWERPIARRCFTVLHEVGHCVHRRLGLVPRGARDSDFAGMATDRCGSGNFTERRAVELYARYMCRSGNLYHSLPPLESGAHATQRLFNLLFSAPAFANVPRPLTPQG